ncbi:hypothetical protein IG631_15522 [Alternaria alternata]|nr:hypothetical protein IG631_15522 [Alternaria alternata]
MPLERLRSCIVLYISSPANPGRLLSLKPGIMALDMKQIHLVAPITFTRDPLTRPVATSTL